MVTLKYTCCITSLWEIKSFHFVSTGRYRVFTWRHGGRVGVPSGSWLVYDDLTEWRQSGRCTRATSPKRVLWNMFPFLIENGDFFLLFGLSSTRIRWKRLPKSHLLKTLSRVKIFENASHSFTCGRTKTEVFEYNDVIHHYVNYWLNACSVRDSIAFPSYSIVYRGKKSPFSKLKYPDTCGWGLKVFSYVHTFLSFSCYKETA